MLTEIMEDLKHSLPVIDLFSNPQSLNTLFYQNYAHLN